MWETNTILCWSGKFLTLKMTRSISEGSALLVYYLLLMFIQSMPIFLTQIFHINSSPFWLCQIDWNRAAGFDEHWVRAVKLNPGVCLSSQARWKVSTPTWSMATWSTTWTAARRWRSPTHRWRRASSAAEPSTTADLSWAWGEPRWPSQSEYGPCADEPSGCWQDTVFNVVDAGARFKILCCVFSRKLSWRKNVT